MSVLIGYHNLPLPSDAIKFDYITLSFLFIGDQTILLCKLPRILYNELR